MATRELVHAANPSRFPQVGIDIVPVGLAKYRIHEFVDSGSSTRVFTAKRLPDSTVIPHDQAYRPAHTSGLAASIIRVLPDEVIVKCLSSKSVKLFVSIANEFSILDRLNAVETVWKPIGYYLSGRTRCNDVTDFDCQYIVMSRAGSRDMDRIVAGNLFRFHSPILDDTIPPTDVTGRYSFELFIASLGLTLISELENLHRVGVVHGDVRANNIAVGGPGNMYPFLLDLGASRIVSTFVDQDAAQTALLRDFEQVGKLLASLIQHRVTRVYGDSNRVSAHRIFRMLAMAPSDKESLRSKLLEYLKQMSQPFDGRLMFIAVNMSL